MVYLRQFHPTLQMIKCYVYIGFSVQELEWTLFLVWQSRGLTGRSPVQSFLFLSSPCENALYSSACFPKIPIVASFSSLSPGTGYHSSLQYHCTALYFQYRQPPTYKNCQSDPLKLNFIFKCSVVLPIQRWIRQGLCFDVKTFWIQKSKNSLLYAKIKFNWHVNGDYHAITWLQDLILRKDNKCQHICD